MWQAQIFTLYPDIYPGPLSKGLYGKALSNKIWDLKVINIRDAAEDKHKTVDDTPFGGGSGMLLKADVLAKSLDKNKKEGERIFYLSPKGKKLDQKLALELSKEKSISLICGHFEGVDERIFFHMVPPTSPPPLRKGVGLWEHDFKGEQKYPYPQGCKHI